MKQWLRYLLFAALMTALLVAVVVGAVTAGGGDGGGDRADAGAGGDAGHIHGLGVDPTDGSLLIATHAGLFRAGEGSIGAERVGTSDRDLMGFSVVGPGHFLGSGHPGGESGLPASLGLIESRDGGRTWHPVSLLGEADFHVLRVAGRRIYGYDSVNGRFLVSTDLGRDWTEREVPAVPFDLAIDPADPERLIAATDTGLRRSRDAGRTWQPVSEQIALLAWAQTERLFLLTPDGRLLLSRDGGRTARPQGTVEGQPVAFQASGETLYVARADGTVLASQDGGATFSVRARL